MFPTSQTSQKPHGQWARARFEGLSSLCPSSLLRSSDGKVEERGNEMPTNKAGDRPNEAEQVEQAMAEFPKEFGLRGFPGKVFSISASASYVNAEGVQLYVHIKDEKAAPDRCWSAWAKGTARELRSQIVKLGEEN
jgi:hypothetical protein